MLKVVVVVTQAVVVPVIAAGSGNTVTVYSDTQPVLNPYVMVATPVLTAVTRPVDEPTVATEPLVLHVPPITVLVKVRLEPRHNVGVPTIAAGNGLISIGLVVIQPVGNV